MVVFRGLSYYRIPPCPTVVAVGNFDGVHLGHRKILERLRALARERKARSLVLTFHPHPERALGTKSVLMIDTLDQRLERLASAHVDAVVVAAFDRSFAAIGAEDFVRVILAEKLGAGDVVVGRNFRFGKNRRGDVSRLRTLGRPLALRVHIIPPAVVHATIVSSSVIRRRLAAGRVEEAARLLGRPYEIVGKVVRGARRGQTLGFPTANVRTENELLPDGVFISQTLWKRQALPSVTSIGTNPTFGKHPVSVESHVLSGAPRMYGAQVTLRLLQRIRPTRSYSGPRSLAARIRQDVETARAFFGSKT